MYLMTLLAKQEPQFTNAGSNPKVLCFFSTIMSFSQPQQLTEVKHLAWLNGKQVSERVSGSVERKTGRYRPKRDKGMKGGKGYKKNIYRDMHEVSSPSGNARCFQCTEQMQWLVIEEENREREGSRREERMVQRRDTARHKRMRDHYCVLLRLLGFSYFSAHHHSPGTRCEQRNNNTNYTNCLPCVWHSVHVCDVCGWLCVCPTLKAFACFIRFKAKHWNSSHKKQNVDTLWPIIIKYRELYWHGSVHKIVCFMTKGVLDFSKPMITNNYTDNYVKNKDAKYSRIWNTTLK